MDSCFERATRRHMPGPQGFVMGGRRPYIAGLPPFPNTSSISRCSTEWGVRGASKRAPAVEYPNASLGGLPVELKSIIFEQVRSKATLKAIGLVCRQFHNLVKSIMPWTFGLDIISDDFWGPSSAGGVPLRKPSPQQKTLPRYSRLLVTVLQAPMDSELAGTEREQRQEQCDALLKRALLGLPQARFQQINWNRRSSASHNAVSVENLLLLLRTQHQVRHLTLPYLYYWTRQNLPQLTELLSKLRSLGLIVNNSGEDLTNWTSMLTACSHIPALSIKMSPDHEFLDYSTFFTFLQTPAISTNLVKLVFKIPSRSFLLPGRLRFPRMESLTLGGYGDSYKILEFVQDAPMLSAFSIDSGLGSRTAVEIRDALNKFLSRSFPITELVLHLQRAALPDISVLLHHASRLRAFELIGCPQSLAGESPSHYKAEDMVTLVKACHQLRHMSIALPRFENNWEDSTSSPPNSAFLTYFDHLATALILSPSLSSLCLWAFTNIPVLQFDDPDFHTRREQLEEAVRPVAELCLRSLSLISRGSADGHIPRLLALFFSPYDFEAASLEGSYELTEQGLRALKLRKWRESLVECDEDWLDFQFAKKFLKFSGKYY